MERKQMMSKEKILKPWDAGYLSGVVDSDGGIYFNRTNKNQNFTTCRLQVDNTSEAMMRKIKTIIGEGSFWGYNRDNDKGLLGETFRPMYRYACSSNTLRWLLPQLGLIAKARQRDIILEALPILKRGRWKTEQEGKRIEVLFKAMKYINHKGTTHE